MSFAKRFYQQATHGTQPDGWAVLLDGRPVRTPAGKPFRVASEALAAAVAAEWQAQEQDIRPDSMPLTRLCMNAIDQIADRRADILEEVLRYAGSDLICYRALEPDGLIERQQRHWQPLVDWLAQEFGASLAVTSGLMPISQPADALAAIRRAVEKLDGFRLTALAMATGAAGSLAVALAMVHGRLDGEGAFEICQLDETFQIEQWGEDYEAADKRAALKADLSAISRFLSLL